ncbi:MAG: diguanylate cyclase domain-containing protein [Gammaproteobacteria bacterium]
MNNNSQLKTLELTSKVLRGRANRYAWIGLLIAVLAIVAATLLTCLYESGRVDFNTVIAAHQNNPGLWLLDAMPLLFVLWGQYIGVMMSYQAGAMVMDETRELREKTTLLEYRLGQSTVPGLTTGLPNRHAFISLVNRALRAQQNPQDQIAILILDTDQHPELEQNPDPELARNFLRQLLARLQNVLREGDILAHFGHDDFAILRPQMADEREARQLASRIQLALDTPFLLNSEHLSIRASVGISLAPMHGDDPDLLIRRAETAKFAAAAERRDAMVYAPSLENARTEQPRLIAELYATLNESGLMEEYILQQPLRSELAPRVRLAPYWPHPRRGQLDEAAFLNLPGRGSLLHLLCAWILREALGRAAMMPRHQQGPLELVLRLPDAAVIHLSIAETVTRMLAAHDFAPQRLTLEVTESALAGCGREAVKRLHALRERGVGICLISQGLLGQSAAAPLAFPLSESRLPAALLQQAESDPRALTVLRHSLQLLGELGQKITLSGADSPALAALARQQPVHYVEGEGIHERMRPDALVRWISAPAQR